MVLVLDLTLALILGLFFCIVMGYGFGLVSLVLALVLLKTFKITLGVAQDQVLTLGRDLNLDQY